MPPTRKRRTRSSASSSTSTNNNIVAPGGGTQEDVNRLANNLGLDSNAVTEILNCQGSGVAAAGGGGGGASAWADFMDEEGFGTSGTKKQKVENSAADKSAADASSDNKSGTRASSTNGTKNSKSKSSGGNDNASDEIRNYQLPLTPRMQINSNNSNNSNNNSRYVTPGILAQTGTLDSTIPGRTKRTLDEEYDLQEPTLLARSSIFHNKHVASIIASSSACHSIAITVEGEAYAWGRNEGGQCGVSLDGSDSITVNPCVVLPTKVHLEGKFVGGAVGKSHSILIDEEGECYAVGGNKYGQCGVNTSKDSIANWKKCVLVGKGKGDANANADDEDQYKVVEASCGENFSVLLTASGHIYSAGLAEFGQLGNGETGEYFVSANKLAFANSTKFERRSEFVTDPDSNNNIITGGTNRTEDGNEKTSPLPDSSRIRIGSISCGKNHTIAVEAPSSNEKHVPRVFSWGCGAYGDLGHNVQADEYKPRLVTAITGAIFTHNAPVRAAAGSQCSMVSTKNGHVYYWGKHRTVGEATMRPALIDALANNGHVVEAVGGGFQTVFAGTKNGVTVSWGNGSFGELGYGKGQQKSSAKPKFVNCLDKCLVTEIACGYGHTLFLVRDEDEEDKNAWKKMAKVEVDDVKDFIKKMHK